MANAKSAHDLFDEEPSADQLFESEGGAEGGGGSDKMPSKPLIRSSPIIPEDPLEKAAREKHDKQSLANDMTHGQWLQDFERHDPERADAFKTKSTENALGEGIAFARGVPFVGGHIDELSSLFQTGKTSGPEYEAKLKQSRGAVDKAVADNPSLPMVGTLAFAPFAPESAGGRVALNTLAGASEGAGAAPSMSEVPKAAALGGGTAFGTSLLGEAVNAGGSALGGKRNAVEQLAREQAQATADKAFASARGKYGSAVANGANLIQSAERAISDVRLPQEVRLKAVEWLDSPEAMALREQVARSNLGKGADALSGIGETQAAMGEARSASFPDAVEAATQSRINDPTALKRRLGELGPRIALPAIGSALAGPAGAAAGATTAAAFGRGHTMLRNLVRDPYVATRLYGAGETALNAMGRSTSGVAPAASRTAVDRYLQLLDKDDEQKKPWGSLNSEEK